MIAQLQSQQKELIQLISIYSISNIGNERKDLGELNNLHKALKLNQDLIKFIQDDNKQRQENTSQYKEVKETR